MRKPDFFDVTEKGKKYVLASMLKDYITDLGFHIYRKDSDPNNYGLVFMRDGILSYVDTKHVKDAVNHEVKKLNNDNCYNLMNLGKDFFSMKFLNGLKIIHPEFLKDLPGYCFLLAENGVTSVSKDNTGIDKYGTFGRTVWKKNIIVRSLEYVKSKKSGDFEKFVSRVAGADFESLKSILGYLIHTYKTPSLAKAVVIYDKNPNQAEGEPNGRTGKSLLIQALAQVRNVAKIPGDRLDFKRQFVFQEIQNETQIAWIDETRKDFQYSAMFSTITDGMVIERKGKPSEFIPFKDSPKFVITTNYRPQGTGDSHDGRKIEFAVTDYYNLKRTPRSEFKKDFFSDEWTPKDWTDFFSFMCECVALYLEKGIIEQKANTDDLKIMSETGADFYHFWITDGNLDEFKRKGIISPRYFFSAYSSEYETDYKYKMREFMRDFKKLLKITKTEYTQDGKGVNLRLHYTGKYESELTKHLNK